MRVLESACKGAHPATQLQLTVLCKACEVGWITLLPGLETTKMILSFGSRVE